MKLSKMTVSFQQYVNELIYKFNTKSTWEDKLKSSLSTVLTEMIAGVGTSNQFYIDFAAREAFLVTAKRSSSIYAIARMLGVHIVRRTPHATKALLTNSSDQTVVIKEYQQFSINGSLFYNRDTLLIRNGETKELSLYSGTLHSKTLDLATQDLQFPEIFLNEEGFTVADSDLRVYTEDKATGERSYWTRSEDSLLELGEGDRKFFDATTGDGDVSLTFGDGQFGKALSIDDNLVISYVQTSGAAGATALAGSSVEFSENKLIAGKTIEPIGGGTAVKDPIYYKRYAPLVHRSRKRMVSIPDWIGNISLYPGVADVVVLSQKDVAPNDPTWMNLVRVCILPENGSSWGGANPNPRSILWTNFVKWASTKTKSSIQTWNPTRVPVEIKVEVTVYEHVDTTSMKDTVTAAIESLFVHTTGTLGKRLAVTDLSDVIMYEDKETRRDGIDYVRVLSPRDDIVPNSKLDYVTARSINVVVKYSEREMY